MHFLLTEACFYPTEPEQYQFTHSVGRCVLAFIMTSQMCFVKTVRKIFVNTKTTEKNYKSYKNFTQPGLDIVPDGWYKNRHLAGLFCIFFSSIT